MSETVDKIQEAAADRLSQMVFHTIASVERQMVGKIGDSKSLSEQADTVVDMFVANVKHNFDELLDRDTGKKETVFNFETLSLVQEEELDVMVAMEGMVNAARNEHLPIFISFNARLSSLFPQKRIDESSNPLDPEQIGTAFKEALRPVGLDANNSLTIYRTFNKEVLKNLDQVLNEANAILIESGVIPDLGLDGGSGRARKESTVRKGNRAESSTFGTVEEESFEVDDDEERPELFSIMQNLLHTDATPDAPAGATPEAGLPSGGLIDDLIPPATGGESPQPAPQQYMVPTSMIPAGIDLNAPADPSQVSATMQPFMPQQGQTVEMVDQGKLMEILSDIQEKLNVAAPPQAIPGSITEVEKLDISQSLGEILQTTSDDDSVISAVDRQSSDIINLVTLLYEAIWQDTSVPIPIKELIGRTQITIIKVALADVEFFNNENHPARAILNEFASAGIGWTEVEALEEDPLYQKIQSQVEQILTEYTGDISFFEDLIHNFQAFRAHEAAKTRKLEQRILKAKERNDRLDDIHQLVDQKIEERILGRELHEFVETLLKGPFHKFMVMLVLKEGPGSNAWKQAINTIDVLLWSVQPHEQDGDRDRLATVNPRLLNNLRKAFRIASIPIEEIDALVSQLQEVQALTFLGGETEADTDEVATVDDNQDAVDQNSAPTPEEVTDTAPEPEADTEADKPSDEGNLGVRFLAAGEFEQAREIEKDEAQTVESALNVEGMETESPESNDLDTDALDIDIQVETTATEEDAEVAVELPDELADDDPHMSQVDSLAVGMWVEFAGEEDSNTRCKLAAKINAIDKFIFVNRQGVKVVEKTRMGLALELRDGTVSIVSDGLLFSRALESVIGNLRESQQEQHTGGAYQPGEGA